MAIISNSVGSTDDKEGKEAEVVEKTLGLPVIRHERKKPAVRDDILDHFDTKDAEKIAVVGDRILSDVVMGNSHGMFSIYVEPFDTKDENFMVKMVREFENRALPHITP